MIVVKIELWPWGEESRKVELGTARIWNDASGSSTVGNYGYELKGKSGSPMGKGEVKDFPRQRLMAWDLLLRVLRDARGKKNPVSEAA